MATSKIRQTIGKKGDAIFQFLLLLWPILQYIIFYIFVNLNSFKLAFTTNIDQSFTTEHFEHIFSQSVFAEIMQSVGTSLLFYAITTFVSVPLALFFAYYIYKKAWGSKLFRLFLFLPSIVSSMVMVVLFTFFMEKSCPMMLENLFGIDLQGKPIINWWDRSSYTWVILFYLWTNFGTTTLIYSNKMAELSPETVEAAQLDGVNQLQEFFYIVLPFTFPTLSVFLVTGLATIFANQYNIFSFYGGMVGFDTGSVGYYIFNMVQGYNEETIGSAVAFNRASALSLLITAIVIPVTLTARWALEKYGPQE